jgi:hypothetical protein
MTPRWPAIIRYAAEAELGLVSDECEWSLDADLSSWPYSDDDELIDSDCRVFAFGYSGVAGRAGSVTLEPTGRTRAPEEVHQIIRKHLLAIGLGTLELEKRCSNVSGVDLAAQSIQYLLQKK